MDDALKITCERYRDLHIDKDIEIKYLATPYLVSPDPVEVAYLKKKGQVSKREKIIILHYLIQDKSFPLTGKLIDFRDVPSGNMYNSVFEARVYQPFLALFGKDPSLFIKASEALEGEKVDMGDIAFRFMALPKIPVIFILYKGDEEFPPACKTLFDSSISDYLPTEDIAIVCEDLVIKLKK